MVKLTPFDSDKIKGDSEIYEWRFVELHEKVIPWSWKEVIATLLEGLHSPV